VKSEWFDLKRVLPFASLGLLTLLICMTKYADYDLWWHLKRRGRGEASTGEEDQG
jgi:hypothetical protein